MAKMVSFFSAALMVLSTSSYGASPVSATSKPSSSKAPVTSSKPELSETLEAFGAKLDELERMIHQGELKAVDTNTVQPLAPESASSNDNSILVKRVENLEHEVYAIKTMLEQVMKTQSMIAVTTPENEQQVEKFTPPTEAIPGELSNEEKNKILEAAGLKEKYVPAGAHDIPQQQDDKNKVQQHAPKEEGAQLPATETLVSNGSEKASKPVEEAAPKIDPNAKSDTAQEPVQVDPSTLEPLNPVEKQMTQPAAEALNPPYPKIKTTLPPEQFEKGKAAFDNKKFALAEEELKKFVKDYPRHELTRDALFLLGQTYMALDKDNDAQSAFAKAYMENNTGENAAKSLLFIGDLFIKHNAIPKACKMWLKLQKDFPNLPKSLLKDAETRLKTNACLTGSDVPVARP